MELSCRAFSPCLGVLFIAAGCGETTARVIVPSGPDASASDASIVMGALGTPVGFAAVPASNIQTTTGGGTRLADIVSNCVELQARLEDPDSARVVVVSGTIDCRRAPEVVNTCERDCEASANDPNRKVYRLLPSNDTDCSQVSGGTAADAIVQKTRNETVINVASNKTLLGQGTSASVMAASLYIKGQSNVIIQNIALGDINSDILEAGDAITIDGSDHVWVDHCSFVRVSDGFVDAINGSSDITLSWNAFEGANPDACAGQHNYAHTIEGASVTFHHNFYDHTLSCSPKISRSARTHLYNNYWLNVLDYSVQVATESQALIQANDFEDSKNPYQTSGSCFDDATPCGISAPDDSPNQFEGTSASEVHETGGAVDALPYDASSLNMDDANGAKRAVTANAGPTLDP